MSATEADSAYKYSTSDAARAGLSAFVELNFSPFVRELLMSVIIYPFNNVQEETDIGGITGLLFNYAIGGHHYRYEHKLWLDKVAVPFLKDNSGRTVALFGMASRSGDADFNLQLSEYRVQEVKTYLKLRGIPEEQFLDVSAMGESMAEAMGEDDGTEDATFRSVKVFLFFEAASE